MAASRTRVYVAGGDASNHLVVADHQGAVVKTLSRMPGPTAVQLSADNQTLYVALSRINTIVALDAESLAETARYEIDVAECIGSLARAGHRLWFGYGCDQWGGNIGFIDLSATPPTSATGLARDLYGAPPVAAAANNTEVLLTGERGLSPASIYSYRVDSAGKLTMIAEDDHQLGSFLGDIALSNDGGMAFAVTGNLLEGFRINNLGNPVRRFHGGRSPFRLSPEGGRIAARAGGGDDTRHIRVFAMDTVEIGRIALPERTDVSELVWTPDGTHLLAVVADSSDDQVMGRLIGVGAPSDGRRMNR